MKQAGRAKWLGGTVAGVIVLAAGTVWLWLGGGDGPTSEGSSARPLVSITQSAASGHTPLHVNCKHHSHGAAWHKDHGRILGARRDDVDDEDLPGRPPLR